MYAFLLSIIAQIISFIQLQGQFVWKWPKEHPYVMMFLGLPISLLFIKVTRIMNEHFDGQNWHARLIGFSIGVVVFTVMSWLIFNEHPNPKTLVCLGLALLILLIQIWK